MGYFILFFSFVVHFLIQCVSWFGLLVLYFIYRGESIPSEFLYGVFVLSFVSVVLPALLSHTSWVERVLIYLYGGRQAKGADGDRLWQAFSLVCEQAKVEAADYRLFVSREPVYNAWTVGHRDITVTAPLLQQFSLEELSGVLAHELGHLKRGHTRLGLWMAGMEWMTRVLFSVYRFLLVVGRGIMKIPYVGWLVFPLVLLFALQMVMLRFCLALPFSFLYLWRRRKEEYEADDYAYDIGLGAALFAGLHHLVSLGGYEKRPWYRRLWDDHPDMIGRLRRLMERGTGRE